jgi:hypothetical protein
MKIIKNEKLIKRNGTIGNYANIAGLVFIIIPLYFYIQAMSQNDFKSMNITLIMGLTLVGMIASQIGMYMGNRWGKSPRPDEKFDAGLKGLHSEFSIYHYSSPVSHLLVGPSGVWILLPYHQRGEIVFEKDRWKAKGGSFAQKYMRAFGPESLGHPELDAEHETRTLQKFFPAMKIKQLKEFLRQGGKNRALSNDQIKKLTDVLES